MIKPTRRASSANGNYTPASQADPDPLNGHNDSPVNQADAQGQGEQRVWPDERELQALGRVMHAASSFEHTLRQAFCALIDSKYAAVVVGAEQAGSLIDKCKLLAKAQRDISEDQKDQICELLSKCKEVSQERNRLIHDMWALGPNAVTHQLSRERRGHGITSRPVTVDNINEIAANLTGSSAHLRHALFDILGPERSTIEVQLRWEEQLATMPPDQQHNLLVGRLRGMLGELARLLRRYREDSSADWADSLKDSVAANLRNGLTAVRKGFSAESEVRQVVLQGEPVGSLLAYQRNQEPNAQLRELCEQIPQLAYYLEATLDNEVGFSR